MSSKAPRGFIAGANNLRAVRLNKVAAGIAGGRRRADVLGRRGADEAILRFKGRGRGQRARALDKLALFVGQDGRSVG